MSGHNRLFFTIFSYPPTWIALLTVGLLQFSLYYWFHPPLTLMMATAGGGFALFCIWPVLFIKSKVFADRFFGEPKAMGPEEKEKLRLLEADLKEMGSTQGVTQLKFLREKFESLTDVLKRRLSAGELTYGRYLGTAEQVYLSAVDNLNDLTVSLKSVSSIHPGYINKRLKELGNSSEAPAEKKREIASLEKRLSLRDEQLKRVSELLAQNESAMTALDHTASAMAETRTGKGEANMDAEAAMAELEMLANRASKYSSTG